MKTQIRNQKRHGFTLVELLVVIVIIASLAGLSFAGVIAALKKAKQVTGKAMASDISTAVNQFYADYSVLPDPTGTAVADATYLTNTANGNSLLTILLGIETAVNIQNEKRISYLTLKEASNGNKDGVVYLGDAVNGLYDPFGQPFSIIIDYNYDDKLEFNPHNTGQLTLRSKRVAVFSPGEDDVTETTKKSLIKTW